MFFSGACVCVCVCVCVCCECLHVCLCSMSIYVRLCVFCECVYVCLCVCCVYTYVSVCGVCSLPGPPQTPRGRWAGLPCALRSLLAWPSLPRSQTPHVNSQAMTSPPG